MEVESEGGLLSTLNYKVAVDTPVKERRERGYPNLLHVFQRQVDLRGSPILGSCQFLVQRVLNLFD